MAIVNFRSISNKPGYNFNSGSIYNVFAEDFYQLRDTLQFGGSSIGSEVYIRLFNGSTTQLNDLTNVGSGALAFNTTFGSLVVYNGSGWVSAGAGGAGVTAHSALTGLSSDDHTQYLLVDGTRTGSNIRVIGSAVAGSIVFTYGSFNSKIIGEEGLFNGTFSVGQQPQSNLKVGFTTSGSRTLQITNASTGSTNYGTYTSATGAGGSNYGFYTTAANAGFNYAGWFDAGNVGIGTGSPSAKLHTVGTVRAESEGNAIEAYAKSNDRTIWIKPTSGTIDGSNTALYLNRQVTSNLYLAEGGGSVSIGSPISGANTLTVTGTTKLGGNTLVSGSADSAILLVGSYIKVYSGAATGGSGTYSTLRASSSGNLILNARTIAGQTGSVYLNFDASSGTGGTTFGNGSGVSVASIDSSGRGSFNGSLFAFMGSYEQNVRARAFLLGSGNAYVGSAAAGTPARMAINGGGQAIHIQSTPELIFDATNLNGGSAHPQIELWSSGTPKTLEIVNQATGGSAYLSVQDGIFTRNGSFSGSVIAGSVIAGDVIIPNVFTATREPTGFADRVATLSLDNTTRTVSITGSHTVYINGSAYFKNTGSAEFANSNGRHFIYYDSVGSLQSALTFPGFYTPFAALVYWNVGSQAGMLSEERHGITMDGTTHEYLHSTVGTRYESGLAADISAGSIVYGSGYIHDEDIRLTLPGGSLTSVLYMNGSTTYTWTPPQETYYLMSGADIAYNNGSTVAPLTTNQYVAYWIFATNIVGSPFVSLMGQRTDTILADARANNTYESLNLGTLPSNEMKLLYRIILRDTGSPPSYIETQDYRSVSNLPGGTYVATDHGTLTGLTDDDHTQYVLADGTRAMTNLSVGSIVSSSTGSFAGSLLTPSISSGSVFTNWLVSNGQISVIGSTINTQVSDANLAFGRYPQNGSFQQLYWYANQQRFATSSGFQALAGVGSFPTLHVSGNGSFIGSVIANTGSFSSEVRAGTGSFGNIIVPGTIYSTNNGIGSNIRIGDDVWLGDLNTANTLFIMGDQNRAAGSLGFGSQKDTRIYRAGVSHLKTDGDFTAAGGIYSNNTYYLDYASASDTSSGIRVRKIGNTASASGSVNAFAELGYHGFYGWDGAAYQRGAYAIAYATQVYNPGSSGGRYAIATTPNNSNTTTPRFWIDQDGAATFGTSNKVGGYDVYLNGILANTTRVLDSGRNLSNIGSLSLVAGNNNVTTTLNQLTFSYNAGADQYRHAIKTRHMSSSAGSNAFDFFVFNYGTDGIGSVGTKHVATLDATGVGVFTKSPTASFEVVGDGKFSGSVTVTGSVSGGSFYGYGGTLSGLTASPAGSSTNVQFNNGGVLSGDADFTFDSTGSRLTVLGSIVTSYGSVAGNVLAGSYYGWGGTLTGVSASATPAGSSTTLQFNDGGTGSGDSNLTWNKATKKLNVAGSVIAVNGSFTGSLYVNYLTSWDNIEAYDINIANSASIDTINFNQGWGYINALNGLDVYVEENLTLETYNGSHIRINPNYGGATGSVIVGSTLAVLGNQAIKGNLVTTGSVSAGSFFGYGGTLTGITSSSFTWSEVTGTSQAIVKSNGYVANNVSRVIFTLPASAAIGDTFKITGKGTGGWRIAQNAGQTVYFGIGSTTTGVNGSVDTSERRDSVEVVCVTANNDFNIISAVGNLDMY
jgi:hypothetical protein